MVPIVYIRVITAIPSPNLRSLSKPDVSVSPAWSTIGLCTRFPRILVIAALLALAPYLAAGFFPARVSWLCAAGCRVGRRSSAHRCFACPICSFPSSSGWFSLGMARALCGSAGGHGPGSGAIRISKVPRTGRSFSSLRMLGLAVDLRWFERAWPAHLSVFNKVLLLDAGIYAFIADPQPRRSRLRSAPAPARSRHRPARVPLLFAAGAGAWPGLRISASAPVRCDIGAVSLKFAGAWLFTFFLIAVPEELFFRGWLQNLLERHIGQARALLATAILFGLSHFNKRAVLFNWRYVMLAAIAGIFYGRAWRRDRRVGRIGGHACHRRLSLVAVASLTAIELKESPCPRTSDSSMPTRML